MVRTRKNVQHMNTFNIFNLQTSFTTSAVESSISPGFAGRVNLVLTLPRQTNHNYSFDLSTRAVSTSANALSILASM